MASIGAAGELAGDGRLAGASSRAVSSDSKLSTVLAARSRAVSGSIPNNFSSVAGIEEWSYKRWSIVFFGIQGETITAGTLGPYCSKVKPNWLCPIEGVV